VREGSNKCQQLATKDLTPSFAPGYGHVTVKALAIEKFNDHFTGNKFTLWINVFPFPRERIDRLRKFIAKISFYHDYNPIRRLS
jgi:hypothetical protein